MATRKPTKRPGKKRASYNDHELCKDIASAALTTRAIAEKHGISHALVYSISIGRLRPELKIEIDGLIEAAVDEVRRVFKSQARLLSLRLLSIAMNKDGSGNEITERNLDIAYKATVKALEFAGLSSETNIDGVGGNMTFTIKYV